MHVLTMALLLSLMLGEQHAESCLLVWQDELAATKSGSILYRQCYQELFDLADAARARQSGQSQDHQIQHSPAQACPLDADISLCMHVLLLTE